MKPPFSVLSHNTFFPLDWYKKNLDFSIILILSDLRSIQGDITSLFNFSPFFVALTSSKYH